MSSNTRQLALGALAAAALGIIIILLVPSPERGGDEESQSQGLAAVTEDAARPEVPDESARPAEPDLAEAEDGAEEEAPPSGASVDTFRLEPDGTAVLAGRAEAGDIVELRLGDDAVARAEADPNGAFVALLTIPPSDQPRVLRLVTDPDGAALMSDVRIMVAPFALPEPEPPVAIASADSAEEEPITVASVSSDDAGAAPEDAQQEPVTDPTGTGEASADSADLAVQSPEPSTSVAETVVEEGNGTVETASEDVSTDQAATEGAQIEAIVADGTGDEAAQTAQPDDGGAAVAADAGTPPVLIADEDGVRLLPAPEVMSAVALDTITYDPDGEVELAGRGTGEGFVQIYIDNQPVTTSRIDEDGGWRMQLPEVDSGIYTLRIDEVDDAGEVVSRIETPFKREEAEAVAAVLAEETAEDGFEVAVRTVQPGSTLWAIATEELGEGILYVAVFEANRDLIKDPDLIYPGQVFRIPELAD